MFLREGQISVCVFVSVLLKFNSTTATALSRGTCDCASDLGRDTPSYSCCLFVFRIGIGIGIGIGVRPCSIVADFQ